jgi:AraC-like DNA-binding protein
MTLARNTLLVATLDLAESLGLSRDRIYQEIEIDERSAEAPDAMVPAAKVIDAMEFAAWRTQRMDFGLMIAERRDHLNLGLLGLLIEQCATVSEVHEVGRRYLHLHNGALSYDLVRERARAVAKLTVHASSNYEPRHYVEALAAMYVRMLRMILGSRWRPQGVYFAHEQLGGRSGYERRFGRNVKFRQRYNGVIFKLGDVDRKGPARDPQAKLRYENLLRELNATGASHDFISEVGRLARMLLPSGGANMNRIAQMMATSTRSLQRRLAERGTTFNDVLADTRTAMARQYLAQDGMTVHQLAPLLGFSEPSAVSRFLTKKAGTSARALKQSALPRRGVSARR